MNSSWTVTCGSCDRSWQRAGNWSAFEQEAIESRPCPHCGAYTLRSPEPGQRDPEDRGPVTRLVSDAIRRMVWAVG